MKLLNKLMMIKAVVASKKRKSVTILFVRHSIALDRRKALRKRVLDRHRELTPKGRKKFEKILKRHRKEFASVDAFVSSPFSRARQTLEMIIQLDTDRKRSRLKTKIKIFKKLRPEDSPQALLKFLNHTRARKMVLVSHEPFMSHFMSQFFGSGWKPRKIKKGQIIKIKFDRRTETRSYKFLK